MLELVWRYGNKSKSICEKLGLNAEKVRQLCKQHDEEIGNDGALIDENHRIVEEPRDAVAYVTWRSGYADKPDTVFMTVNRASLYTHLVVNGGYWNDYDPDRDYEDY